MKKIIKIGISLSFLVILLIVVVEFIFPRVFKSYDFISNKNCTAPCLENIIPGVTTEADAIKNASNNKNLGTCKLKDQSKQPGIPIICESFLSSIKIGFDKNLVSDIMIIPYPNISVKAIINKFGYPDGVSCFSVNLPDHPKTVGTMLYFDKYQMQVKLTDIAGDTCTIFPNSNIAIVYFGVNEIYGTSARYEDSKSAAKRLNFYQRWGGFNSYPGINAP
jgi:hypothetical protein